MSRISRIAAEQVTRVMNMQKTVNFDAARYFRFLFPSTFPIPVPCVSISIFSHCEREQSEYLTGTWSDLYGWNLFFLLDPKMKADSRRDEIETFFIDYKGRRTGARISKKGTRERGTPGASYLPPLRRKAINPAMSLITPLPESLRNATNRMAPGNMPRSRQRSINLHEKQR